MSTTRTTLRTRPVALRAMLIFTLVLGIAYTAIDHRIGQLVLPSQANGSLITIDGGESVGRR